MEVCRRIIHPELNNTDCYRWLYVIEGGGTMIAGILAIWLLPDFPRSGQKKWLSEEEQRFAEWRLAREANDETDENGGVKAGIVAALTDIKVWLLVLTQVCLLSSQTWTYFFPVRSQFCNFHLRILIQTPVNRSNFGLQQDHNPAHHGACLYLRLLHLPR